MSVKPKPLATPIPSLFIPEKISGQRLSRLPLSASLFAVLKKLMAETFGDLSGMTIRDFQRVSNRGTALFVELTNLAQRVRNGEFAAAFGDCLTVPARVQDLNFCDLPISVRLSNILEKTKATRLGDLNGASISELKNTENCGEATISEIVNLIEKAAAGEFKTITDANVVWSPVDLTSFLDTLISELPARGVKVLDLRLSGEKKQLPTLEDVGAKFKLTRERIRQIAKKTTEQLRKAGSRRLNAYLLQVEKICREMVCPLTPELFEQWLGEKARLFRFSPGFYVRLLCELNPSILAWHGRQDTFASKENYDGAVETELKALLQVGLRSLALSEAFSQMKAKLRNLDVGEFFDVLRHARQFRVEFLQPNRPTVKLARFPVADMARIVLQASDSPLTPEEILAQAQANFGQDISKWSPRPLGNALSEEKGFFSLGPRIYGLSQHFTLPKALRTQAKTDFEKLLTREKRPVSTPDVIHNQRFDWINQTNSHELACILRADDRFIDLGKFLFALAEWGIQKREYVKDLIPRILEQAGRPLTGSEVLDRLQQLRSVSPHGISGYLRKHPQVHDYGFGHFGLKSWGDSIQASIVTDPVLVERVTRLS
jgi:DNA repair protein RadC